MNCLCHKNLYNKLTSFSCGGKGSKTKCYRQNEREREREKARERERKRNRDTILEKNRLLFYFLYIFWLTLKKKYEEK